jgi:hypothetical protein
MGEAGANAPFDRVLTVLVALGRIALLGRFQENRLTICVVCDRDLRLRLRRRYVICGS